MNRKDPDMTETWYVILCRVCNPDLEDARNLWMPFETAEARGRWAAEHKRATGHDRWFVIDQPKKTEAP
jgi:hypothetical protein